MERFFMWHTDPITLARIQFAFTIAFHILFPAFSIGLATFLAIMEGAFLKTKKSVYFNICKFWMKIFALTFGMGVVSGIVMEFQLGTNWSQYTQAVGPALGGLFTYEVLTAFFIEAGFLGVMIFGWERVGHKLHYLSTILVVIGVTVSAFWIVSANSWMQFPAGVTEVNGKFVVTDWLKVIFNPLVIPRYLHMLLSAYITTGWVIVGICSYYLLKDQYRYLCETCLKWVIPILLVLIPIQIFLGDRVGLNILHHQPIKTAAIEANWQAQKGAPLLLFAIPLQNQERNIAEISIPKGASLINTHHLNGELPGLKDVSAADRPWVAPVFFSFRIMVGLGVLMLILAVIGTLLLWRRRLFHCRPYLKTCVFFSPAGFIAILTGWFTAEIGRQPWVVQGQLRTLLSASDVSLRNVVISFVLIILVYGVIFGIFYFRYLTKIIQQGPEDLKIETSPFVYMAEEK
jgi:cytochrome bd ubiquinol oxidase subunit I